MTCAAARIRAQSFNFEQPVSERLNLSRSNAKSPKAVIQKVLMHHAWTVHSVLSGGCISVASKHEHGVLSVFKLQSQTVGTGIRKELRDRLEEEDFKSKLLLIVHRSAMAIRISLH